MDIYCTLGFTQWCTYTSWRKLHFRPFNVQQFTTIDGCKHRFQSLDTVIRTHTCGIYTYVILIWCFIDIVSWSLSSQSCRQSTILGNTMRTDTCGIKMQFNTSYFFQPTGFMRPKGKWNSHARNIASYIAFLFQGHSFILYLICVE